MKSSLKYFLIFITASSCSLKQNSPDVNLVNEQSPWYQGALDSAIAIVNESEESVAVISNTFDFPDKQEHYEIHLEFITLKNKKRYGKVNITNANEVITALFLIRKKGSTQVIKSSHSTLTYMGDTIVDVNGDDLEDILIHWYPLSGCCRRNMYDVYLADVNGTFSPAYQFLNPTFSANEKIIRGVLYGHQDEVGLYKYRWNSQRIDTVEFIYKNPKSAGGYIRTRKKFLDDADGDNKTYLGDLPEEYQSIEDIDWFMNK